MKPAIAFDTLEYLHALKSGGISDEQAEAITKANAKAFLQMMEVKEIATKSDIEAIKTAINELEHRFYAFVSKSLTWSLSILCCLQTLFHFLGN